MIELTETKLEYIYITIPAEYICVYHRILTMLSDFGEEMLKDCKASCTDKNSGVIECFNMFNSAVAARKLGKTKLAETIIKYVKAKINQIYKGRDNSTNFVFPIDDDGKIKAFVTCGNSPKFEIDLSSIVDNNGSTINPDDKPLDEENSCGCKNDNYKIKHIILTQQEYDALPNKEENVLYLIVNDDGWHFGDKFPIKLK